jgi:hypothetical protein
MKSPFQQKSNNQSLNTKKANLMKKLVQKYPSQIIGAAVSFFVFVLSAALIEYQIEGRINDTGLSELTIPISIAFSLIANIVVLLNVDIVTKIPGIEKLMHTIDRQHDVSTRLFESLKTEQVELQKIYSHLQGRKIEIQEYGNELIKHYLAGFKLYKGGIALEGEHWSLQSYIQFWQYLAEKQQNISEHKNQNNIIVRLTHSNDINIWRTSSKPYKEYAEDAYLFQKKFIKHGGIVVRVLIGEVETPTDDYKEVIAKMENIGIEVKYLPQSEVPERDFDFLFLADEEIVLKWFSGNNGRRLSKCEITDHVEDVVRRTWASLFEKLLERGDPIVSIPKERQHFI